MQHGYMGVFVEEEKIEKSCQNCKYCNEVDRAECNACSREWNNSKYTQFIGWKPNNGPIF